VTWRWREMWFILPMTTGEVRFFHTKSECNPVYEHRFQEHASVVEFQTDFVPDYFINIKWHQKVKKYERDTAASHGTSKHQAPEVITGGKDYSKAKAFAGVELHSY